jgi:hypothetical protein
MKRITESIAMRRDEAVMAVGGGRRKGGGHILDRYDPDRTKTMRANEQCRFTLQPLTDSIGPLTEAVEGSDAVLKSASTSS